MRWYGKAVASLLLCLLTLSHSAFSGGEIREAGARSFSMGGAGVALPGDLWAAMRNPALLTDVQVSALASWQPGRFGLRELASASMAGVMRSGSFGIGAAVSHFGGPLYREVLPSAGIGMRVGEQISFGGQASLLCLSIDRYGSTAIPVFDVGASVRAAPSLLFAAAAGNVTQAAIVGSITDRLPVTLRLGACWLPDSALLLQAEIDKDIRWPATMRFGGEYRPLDVIALRAGATTTPWTTSAGLRLRLGGLLFDYAYCWHPDLGGSHALGIGIEP